MSHKIQSSGYSLQSWQDSLVDVEGALQSLCSLGTLGLLAISGSNARESAGCCNDARLITQAAIEPERAGRHLLRGEKCIGFQAVDRLALRHLVAVDVLER